MNPGANRRGDPPASRYDRKIRLVIAYDGLAFHGWQRQSGLQTVQACLEEAVAGITGEPATIYGSGRTDAGVHALGQVAHFVTSRAIPSGNLQKALNDVLPPQVRILSSEEAPLGFHARYAARSKLYRYRILQAEVCLPFAWRYVWHYPLPLDRRRISAAAKSFLGEHDFTSFAASAGANSEPDSASAGSESKSMVRRIISSRVLWSERRKILAYEVEGSGFLHHMVRNMVGTLVEVGRGALQPGDIDRILKARDRKAAGPTAPAQGLCLVRVIY